MVMKKIIQVLILILYIPGTFAQQKEISGVVSDDKNVLPFVNVLIKGSNKITTTNIDGKYIIKATKGDVLVFSSVGYETEERKVHDSSIINVTMRVSEIPLEEVVVVEEIIEEVEYEEAESVEYLSVSSPVIKRDKVNGRRTNVAKSALYALSNKNTKIKATSNLNTNEEPLYIVDGVIIEGNFEQSDPKY